mgnify:CR=1 FL=1
MCLYADDVNFGFLLTLRIIAPPASKVIEFYGRLISCHLAPKPLVADIFENRSHVFGKCLFDRAPSTSWHPTLDRGSMRCDEAKPETEEIVAESVDRPLALSPKGLLAGNQANALKLFEVVRGFRCGGANCGCYLPLWVRPFAMRR